jgi:hypothetical protein
MLDRHRLGELERAQSYKSFGLETAEQSFNTAEIPNTAMSATDLRMAIRREH